MVGRNNLINWYSLELIVARGKRLEQIDRMIILHDLMGKLTLTRRREGESSGTKAVIDPAF